MSEPTAVSSVTTHADREDWHPLSAGQRSFWFLYEINPQLKGSYNSVFCARVHGRLDEVVLGQALDGLAARHPMLRAHFRMIDEEPRQSVVESVAVPLTFVQADDLDSAELLKKIEAEQAIPFDHSIAPLMKATVYRAGPDAQQSVFVLVLDHLICDGWSFWQLIDELGLLLQSRGGEVPAPTTRGPTFFDHVHQQSEWLTSPKGERQFAYWRDALSEDYPALDIRHDYVDGGAYREARDTVQWTAPPSLVNGLRELALSHGSSLFVVALAGYMVLLARLSAQERTAVGSLMPARGDSCWNGVVGNFANPVVLRAAIAPSLSISELLKTLGKTAWRALRNQEYPFGELVERLHPRRGANRLVYFQTSFVFQKARSAADMLGVVAAQRSQASTITPWGGIGLSPYGRFLTKGGAGMDLSLEAAEIGDTLELALEYDKGRFGRDLIVEHLRTLRTILEAMAADDGRPVSMLATPRAGDRQQVLRAFNDTGSSYDRHALVQEAFEAQARRTPEAVALVYGREQLTYAELDARANRLAHLLCAQGVGPDDLVGLCVERSIDMVVGLMGILKSGAAYVPLDPVNPPERLQYMLADSRARALVAQRPLLALLPDASVPVVLLDAPEDLARLDACPSTEPMARARGTSSRHAAYVIYTSGSTGLPKGVVLEHRSVVNLVTAQIALHRLTSADRVLQFASFGFDNSVAEIFPALAAGACLVSRPADVMIPDAAFERFMREQRITVADLPTAFWHQWAHEISLGRCLPGAELRSVAAGGEKAESRHLAQWQASTSTAGCQWINTYGPTEATVNATALLYAGRTHDPRRDIPIGRPIANTRIYILDPHGEPTPIGIAGEIHIGGDALARGYLNRPELTRERFVPDPFQDDLEARLYKTGDLGRWLPDGTIEYLGRNDFQVKLRGFRIELGEIEAALAACAGVQDAVVVLREDVPGDKRLVAYVVPESGAAPSSAQLRDALCRSLAEYMVPAAFVSLAAFPLNSSNKIDRKALPAPEGDAYVNRGYEAPEGDVEIALAKIWSELLKVDQVGRHDNFFELGGHSLLAIKVVERLGRAGLRVDARTLFTTPSLAALARQVADGRTAAVTTWVPPNRIPQDANSLAPWMLTMVNLDQGALDAIAAKVDGGAANVQDIYPLAPLQEGMLFHHLMESSGDAYLQPSMLSFDSSARLKGFLAALQRVVDRHDILRTGIAWQGLAMPVQVVRRRATLPVTELTFDGDPQAQLEQHIDPATRRLDVSQAPLMQCYVALDEQRGRWLLGLCTHHLALDHVALGAMIAEVRAIQSGREAELSSPLPFRNFVAQARLGVSDSEHEAFFKAMLSDIDEPTAPFNVLDAQGSGLVFREARRPVGLELAERIRMHARRLGIGAASVMHLAWAIVLARLTGRTNVVFGSVLTGRMQIGADTNSSLGIFVNTLPLRLIIDTQGVDRSLKSVQSMLMQLMRHEHAPLALAQRASAVRAPMPLFTTLLNYRQTDANGPDDASPFGSDDGVALLSSRERTNYPLTVDVDDFGDDFVLVVQAAQELDPERVVGYVWTSIGALADALDQDASRPVNSLDILTPEERELLRCSFNDTGSSYDRHALVQEAFEAQARRTPEAVALVYGREQLTYAELDARANRLAHLLCAQGVGPDDLVGLCVERSIDMVVGLMGILKSGAAYVPLDPVNPPERLQYMLADSRARALVAQRPLLALLPDASVPVVLLDAPEDLARLDACPSTEPMARARGTSSRHAAYVIYTSGSTGLPKGVVLEHRSVVNLVTAQIALHRLTSADRVLQFASFGFDNSVAEIFPALAAGACLVSRPADVMIPDAAFERFMREQRITVADLPTAFWHQWAHEISLGRCLPGAELRSVAAGGEKAESRHLAQWQASTSTAGCQWINTYGPTEATVNATALLYAGRTHDPRRDIPIGRPIANTRIYILDPHGEPTPIGIAGEIHIGGDALARGYLNRPELTRERFVPDPFQDDLEARLYKTGDLGRWLPDGTIEYLGRNDFQVKLRGFRIELGEIEAALAACAGVQDAVVVLREDVPGDKRLVAYVVPESGAAPSSAQLRDALCRSLAEYMVPAAFVSLAAFPLNSSNKIDRKALPAPEGDAYVNRGYEAPEGDVEIALAKIWSELLKVDQVGRHDNFFELGGHSLLAVQLVSRVHEALGRTLELKELFAHPVLQQLAQRIAQGGPSEQRPIAPVDRTQPLPLSLAQQRLWFLARMDAQASQAYHIASAVRLDGALDRQALDDALQAIVDRHESLRTRFVCDEHGQPHQVIDPYSTFELDFTDLSHGTSSDLHTLVEHEQATPFDLAQGPLLRVRLVQLQPQAHVLLVTMHHIVSDGWSMGVLIDEFSTLYAAACQGATASLAPLSVQYADYAAWQRSRLEQGQLDTLNAFWREALAGVPTLLELPTDRPRPAQQDYRGQTVPVHLDAELSAELQALSRRHGVTLYMTLLAAWALLLGRLARQDDIVVGSPVAGRNRREVEGLIGFFVNTLALRIDVSGTPDLATLLGRVKTQVLAAQAHQDLPFEQVVQIAQPVRSLAHAPLFQAMFAWQNTPGGDLDLPGLTLSHVVSSQDSAQFDLSLALQESELGIVGGLNYAEALFDHATIERYVGYWKVLLQGLVRSQPQQAVASLDILPEAERSLVLHDWNATEADYPRDLCLHELFEAQAQRTPGALALVHDDERLTYAELNARANQLARHLQLLGARPDDRIALCVERSVAMVVGLLAVLKAGAAYVPLDPAYPADRLAHMLEDSAPKAVLLDATGAQALAGLPRVQVVHLDHDRAHFDNLDCTDLARSQTQLQPHHLAYVIYTSGSTGRPKGAMNEHHAIVNRLAWMQGAYRLCGDDVVLQKTPFSFDVSVWEFFWPLTTGATLQLARPEGHKDPAYLQTVIQRARVTTAHFVPSMLQVFLEQPLLAAHSLRRVVCSGEALPATLVRRFHERLPGVDLHNLYGPTEAAVDVTAWQCETGGHCDVVPIGRPIANTRMYVLDDRQMPVPIGVAGELHIGGVQVGRGYLHQPELTAQRFLPDPFSALPGARMYKTGDLGRWLPDGTLEYLGRNDFQVKIRGFRIELGEIETQLSRVVEARDVVVLARDDGGDKRLVAYYAGEASPETLREHAQAHLPQYMVPSAYVRVEHWPLTPNGKLDRKALPAPEGDAYVSRGYEAPEGDVEIALAKIWSELLKVDQVGRHDNFFELGGHSLLAVQLVSRVHEALGRTLELKELFAHPVLQQLAQRIAQGGPSEQRPIAPVDRTQPLPLSLAQQRLWFLARMDARASQAYHIASAVRLDGALDRQALDDALQAIVDRHESLRTRFVCDEHGQPRQVIDPYSTFELDFTDLSHGTSSDLHTLVEHEQATPFDLAQGPLLRVRLVQLQPQAHVLLVTMHHIVSDGWSMGVLIDEFSTLYAAACQGATASLAPLSVQYADYAAWQRSRLEQGQLDTLNAFWREALAGVPTLLELPTDRPRPAQQDYRGQTVPVHLDAELSAELQALSRRHGVTLYMTLLAAWALLLGRLARQDDIVVGSPVAGRNRREVEGLIGFFVNTLALRIDVSGTPDLATLLGRVKTQVLAAQAHQDLPFEQVVQIAQPVRSLAHAPLFQAMFAWENTPGGELKLPGLTLSHIGGSRDSAQFDLSLMLHETDEGIGGGLNYAEALFDHATIERYVGYWKVLLQGLVRSQPQQSVASLDILPEAERSLVLHDWNATDADYPRDKCLHELFEAQAQRTPGALALVHDDERLTYAELNTRANQLAHVLRARGVVAGSHVALALERSIGLVTAQLAVSKAGAIYVPLDSVLPGDRQARMVSDCHAQWLLCASAASLPSQLQGLDRIDVDAPALLVAPTHDVAISRDAGQAAYVMYTSGSTGRPNGVVVPHRAIARLVLNNGYADFSPADRVAFAANPAFDASTLEVWAPLLNGGTIVVIAQDVLLSPTRLAQALADHGVTVLWMTVGLFNQYHLELAPVLGRLRYLIVGGDALNARVVQTVLAQSPPQHLLNGYGPTETTTFALTHEIRSVAPDQANIPIGRPIANTQVYVLDEQRRPVPVGVPGELHIGGAGVARGYLHQPELTAQRFLPDPFSASPEARMYKTGDLGRWLPDGTLEYLGRNDFQVKIRGFRIELGEIESQLSKLPGAQDLVVLARQDDDGSDKRLVAYYAGEASPETLREHAQAHLPQYMVPSAYVRVEHWPLTPNGKLDRKALPAPEGDAYVSRGYEAPQGDVEIQLAAIWSELLKVDQVGRHDNFFELGGHSLLAVSLIERMRHAGLQADVRTLFTAPSLAELARHVAASEVHAVVVPPNLILEDATRLTPQMVTLVDLSQEELDAIVAQVEGGAANVQDIYPLAPLQEGILFHHLMESDGDAYLLPSVVAFASRERLDRFLAALQRVIDRHDILRTGIAWQGLAQPVQVVRRRAVLPLQELDFAPTDDVRARLQEHIDPTSHRLDVTQAPLMQCHVAHDETHNRWLLGLLVHHLAIDHTTMEMMVAEALAIDAGREAELPAPVPFRTFVAQARLGVSTEEHEAFFKGMLADIDEPTAPYGVLDVQGDGSDVDEVHHLLAPELSARVRQHARRLGVSAASVMHLAWGLVLARVTGRQDVVFGTVLFGRMQGGEQADRGMGMFINTLPLRLRVDEQQATTALKQAHALLVELLHHEHAPLALAQRASAVQAPAPLFTSLLNYRHSQAHDVDQHVELDANSGIEMLSSHESTNYPLTLSVDDLGDDFALTVLARRPIAAERLCAYMLEAINGLLAAIQSEVVQSLSSIDILPAAERDLVLHDWNATDADYPRDKCLHELFEAQAQRTPGALALVHDDERLTYAELNARANQLARHLQSLGARPDDRIALCVERSVGMVVGLLAVLKAGAAYVPLDPAYPADRLAHMLEDSAPKAVLLDATGAQALAGLPRVQVVHLDHDRAHFDNLDCTDLTRSQTQLQPHHLAYVIYTSGSTGRPKGVAVEHASVTNLVSWHNEAFDLQPGEASASTAGVGFDACAWELWAALCNGGRLHLPPSHLAGDSLSLIDWWRSQDLQTSFLVTPLAELAYETGCINPGVRALLVGGDRLRRWPDGIPAGQRIINNYGPTENTVVATSGCVTADDAVLHIGRPIANTQVYVLDEQRRPVPVGVPGALYIGGAGVARGYLHQPELTAQRFLPDPFSALPGARMYKTGDLGRWLPDGTLEYLGRNDFQVKIRGFRIELGEIETQLSRVVEARDVVVLARDDGGDKRLVAYYAGEASPETLREHAQAHLPQYMVPSAYVRVEHWPLTPNGKLDRKALPAPEGDAYVSRGYEAPEGDVEIALAKIWSELLKVDQVGRHDNFFELGGHSLLAVQLVSRVHEALGRTLELKELFAHPVLQQLAQRIAQGGPSEQRPIAPVDRTQPLPLSLAQQRLWFLARMDAQASQAYHIASAVRLDGALDRQALDDALQAIVDRHESLRTRFVCDEHGQPHQVIDPYSTFELDFTDLSHGTSSDLHTLVEHEQATPFDLAQGPLLRVRLVQLQPQAHVLLVTMHHIVSDGWSMGVLIDEFSTLYAAACQGATASLAPLSVQYADYAAWQRSRLEQGQLDTLNAFWREALAGVPTLLELPTDRPRPAQQDYRGQTVPVHLDAELSAELQALSRRHGVTLYMTLLAAWALLLGRLARQDDIVVGSPVAGRNRREVEGLIGFFVNTLALRIDVSGTPDLATLLGRVKTQVLAAQAHQDLPFEQVVQIAQPVRSLAHAPLFQAMFAWQNTPGGDLDLPGLTLSHVVSSQDSAQFDLSLALQESELGIVGGLNYAEALFDHATIERYVGYWKVLLQGLVRSQPQQAVASLDILPEAERSLVLHDWNATEADYPRDLCLHELFEAQAQRTPGALALVHDDERLTYAELNARANQLARHLQLLGARPDDRIALCVERSVAMVVGLLAVLKAGAAYVPLDPAYPADRLAHMLEDSAPKAVLLDATGAQALAGLPRVQVVHLDHDRAHFDNLDCTDLARSQTQLQPHHLAYVIYTSGSTGRPKGVAIEHRNVVNFIHWACDAFSPQDFSRSLFATSTNFDLAVYECFAPLACGGTIELVANALSLLEHPKPVSLVNTVPSALATLVRSGAVPAGVATVNLAGEALRRELVEQIFSDTDVRVVCNLYGPSETTTYSTWVRMERANGFAAHIGRPIANTQVYILDEQRRPVPVGVPGELHIGGAGVARGYLHQPELTAQRFLPDPFSASPEARMYKTGDLGRWLPDGTLEYLGRNDFQVKIRGFRIELGEIESQLSKLPGAQDLVVLARQDDDGSDKRLVAYYAGEASPETLREHAQAHLPQYMVPSAYVRVEHWPLTPNGKLDRKALPAPEGDAYVSRGYEAPQGDVEIQLAAIWSELLKVDQVGRHDNFFELGGHSLLAVSLIERMRHAGLQADVRTLFTAPSLAELARHVAASEVHAVVVPPNLILEDATRLTPQMVTLVDLSQEELDAIVAQVEGGAANVQDIYPLAPLQEGILFHHLMESDGDAYLLPSVVAFASRERLDRFLAALQRVIDRHDILRTGIAWQGLAQPVQVVRRRAVLPLQELDFAPTDDVRARLQEHIDPTSHRLDVTQAPLMQCHVAHDETHNRWLLGLLVHHLAIDHTTMEMMVAEALAIDAGREAELPAPVPFRTFVAQARLGVSTEEHEAFFKGMLADIDEPTAPYGVLDVQGDGSDVDEVHHLLAPELSARVRQHARRLGVSAASVMHLAWGLVLARVTGRHDVVFGTVLFGRMQGGEQADRGMGMFINTLPLRLRVDEQQATTALKQAHALLVELLHHEHAPLALAQRASAVQAPAPLFTSLLNYRHSQAHDVDQHVELDANSGIEMLSSHESTNYPLTLSVDDLGDDFALTVLARRPIAAERLCAYMLEAINGLLAAIQSEVVQSLSSIDILPAAERDLVLHDWNATDADYPRDKCLHELFEAQAQRTPGALALVHDDERLTYAELNTRANQLAHVLRARGVVAGSHVALALERSIGLVTAQLAVSKAGAIYVPLDSVLPGDRQARMVSDCHAQWLLCASAASLPSQLQGLDRIDVDAPALLVAPTHDVAISRDAGQAAYVMYTSGSTGRPNGVVVPHRAIARLVLNNGYADFSPADRVAFAANPAFDASTLEVWAPLLNGGTIVVIAQDVLLSPTRLAQALADHGVTVLWMTVGLFNQYHLELAPVLGRLRYLIVGGDALNARVVQTVLAQSPPQHLLNGYGPTETTTFALTHEIRSVAPDQANIPIGRPIANTQVYVLDEQRRPVPVGVPGELHIGGAGVARGYLHQPELTAQRFLPDPFSASPEARMYKTGDLGRWLPDGTLEYLGRNDFQVKIRGFRIELGEIESQLSKLPGAQDLVVLARQDDDGSDKRLVAYYAGEASPETLREHAQAHLPQYMVPSAYVRVEHWPLTPNGKLDRKALPAPEGDAYVSRGYEAPQGDVEIQLAAIWSELLKVDQVGRHDNFFELGGHSLLAVQVVNRIQQEFHVSLDLSQVFLESSIATLGTVLVDAILSQYDPAEISGLMQEDSAELE